MCILSNPEAVFALIEIESGGVSGEIKCIDEAIFRGIEGGRCMCKEFFKGCANGGFA